MMALPSSSEVVSFSSERSQANKQSKMYTSVDKTEGSIFSRTFDKVVLSGSNRYSLKVSSARSANVKEWPAMTDEDKGFFIRGIDPSVAADSGFVTLYIIDSNGNPVDWTGYMPIWDLDRDENVFISTSSVLEVVERGIHLAEPNVMSKYPDCTRFTGTGSHLGEVLLRDSSEYCITLKLHIPASGMKMRINATTNGGVFLSMLKEIVDRNGLASGSGSWSNI